AVMSWIVCCRYCSVTCCGGSVRSTLLSPLASQMVAPASETPDEIVCCDGLTKMWKSDGPGVLALRDLSFSVRKKEIFAVVGPSGCGKSTMLRILAGVDEPTSGKVLINGGPPGGLNAKCMLIFQEPALFPWLTTRQMVEFPLMVAGYKREAREEALLLADRIMMMTARPGTKKWQVQVPNPRPHEDAFFSKEFAELREHMLRMFYEEVRL